MSPNLEERRALGVANIKGAKATFFVLRSPAFPIEDLIGLYEVRPVSNALRGGAVDLPAGLSRDHAEFAIRLRHLVRNAHFREAVMLASPSLASRLDPWLMDPLDSRLEAVTTSLWKYFARSACRPTPFGLFSACSVGMIGGFSTHLRLLPEDRWTRRSRLDGGVLHDIALQLFSERDVWIAAPLVANGTIHKVGDRLHYADDQSSRSGFRSVVAAVESTPHLRKILLRASKPASAAAIAADCADEETGADEWLAFVRDLVDARVLLRASDVQPVGVDPFGDFLERHRDFRSTAIVALQSVRDELIKLDQAGVGVPEENYRRVKHLLERVTSKSLVGPFVQVDAYRRTSDLILGKPVVDAILDGVSLLYQVGPKADWLAPLRSAFVERFGEREVPLLEALDPEIGIAWADPVAGVVPRPAAGRSALTRLLTHALRSGVRTVALEDDDIHALKADEVVAPPTAFCVAATLVGESSQHVSAGQFQVVVERVSSSSAVALLGRFCHLDAELLAGVRQVIAAEEAHEPDTVFADLQYVPGSRALNVVFRPLLRKAAIPILCCAREGQNVIELSDLLLSVCDGEFKLRSRKLGKYVRPRVDVAHNLFHAANDRIYAFLGFLQFEGHHAFRSWNWEHLEGAPFLPRITVRNIVLRRAEWNVQRGQLTRAPTFARQCAEVERWRTRSGVPQLVLWEDGDHSILIDLCLVTCVEALVRANHKTDIRLVEPLPDSTNMPLEGENGHYASDIVIPFVCDGLGEKPTKIPVAGVGIGERRFALGSEWIYLKIYCGAGTADYILRTRIADMLESLTQADLIDQWHFLRYADPAFHIRLRLRLRPTATYGDVLAITSAYGNEMLICEASNRIQYDTYEREVERYGGYKAVAAAESLFHSDSLAAIGLIQHFQDGWAEMRAVAATISILSYVAGIKVPHEARLDFLEGPIASADKETRHQWSGGFRRIRKEVDAVYVDAAQELGARSNPITTAFLLRSDSNAPAMRTWRDECEAAGYDAAAIMRSFIHMSMNRLGVRPDQELAIYAYASRQLQSLHARGFDSQF